MKMIRNAVLTGLLCVAVGFSLLCLAYAVPASRMQDKCYETVDTFLEGDSMEIGPSRAVSRTPVPTR